jgi:hypothetical protein
MFLGKDNIEKTWANNALHIHVSMRVLLWSIWVTLIGLSLSAVPLGRVLPFDNFSLWLGVVAGGAVVAMLLGWAMWGAIGGVRGSAFNFSLPVQVAWPTPRHKRYRRRAP